MKVSITPYLEKQIVEWLKAKQSTAEPQIKLIGYSTEGDEISRITLCEQREAGDNK